MVAGGISAAVFSFAAGKIGSGAIQKAFGVILIISGAVELFKKGKNKKDG